MFSIELGQYALGFAILVAVAGFLAALAAGRFGSQTALRLGRWCVAAIAALFLVASIVLIHLFLTDEFRADYVARFSERALPFGYKLAAFWAGQEGSLLLWALVLAVMSLIVSILERKQSTTAQAVMLAVLNVACGFFALLMFEVANPFALAERSLADGHGLNPMLQNIGMIAHPPILFLGYAASTIPFALMIGALFAGLTDGAWVARIRRWTLVTWLFLSGGIILGAQWAYVSLGWGGYWAWDPVENASLLPWLTVTALLHSVMAQQHGNRFKVWNVVLVSLTFFLCVFGTYLTRSGVVQSVHAFEKSSIGLYFLAFLALTLLLTIAVIVWRWRPLSQSLPLTSWLTQEGAFFAGNVLLLGMMLITLFGTTYPIICGLVGAQGVSPQPTFYNRAVMPLALVLVAIMAIGPVLGHGKPTVAKLSSSLAGPAVAGAAVMLYLALNKHVSGGWALLSAFVCGVALVTFLVELLRTVLTRAKLQGENLVLALLRTIDANHRRYGGQVAHVGVVLMVAGIVGSSLFATSEQFRLSEGQTVRFAGNTLTLQQLRESDGANYAAVEAVLKLVDSAGRTMYLTPQRRMFNQFNQPVTEVAIRSQWSRDTYVVIGGVDENMSAVGLQVIVSPLVIWIWIGGIVLTAGGVLCLLPRLELLVRKAPLTEPVAMTADAADRTDGAAPTGAKGHRLAAAQ